MLINISLCLCVEQTLKFTVCLYHNQASTHDFFPSILYPGHKMSELQPGVGDVCLKSQHCVGVGGAGVQGSL